GSRLRPSRASVAAWKSLLTPPVGGSQDTLMNPLNPLAVVKQVLAATALSALLMSIALLASKRPVITDFDGWTLRTSIVPPFERKPEQPLALLEWRHLG